MSALPKPSLSKSQAIALTGKIKTASDSLWSLLLEAHDGKAWQAMGYASWEAYIGAEFDMSRRQSYRLLDHGRVTQAIQAASGVTHGSQITERQARDIKPVVKEVAAEIRAKVEAGADPIQTTYAVIEAKRTEVKSEPAKPSKPAKAAPAIESLLEENATLREALQESRDNASELAGLLESYDAVTAGEHAAAKEMARLRAQLRTVEATRDQWMTTAGELRKEVKALQRKLGAKQ